MESYVKLVMPLHAVRMVHITLREQTSDSKIRALTMEG